jgi:hypothetical protein
MNVFEDLVVELKEANLLEETFIDLPLAVNASAETGNGNGSGNGGTKFSVPSANEFGVLDPALNRERLSEQIAAIELVDLVLAAIATANGKQTSPYDALSLKKTFHRFAQTSASPESEEYFELEAEVVSSIDAWEHELSQRDEELSAAMFRRYVETANPPLSPQALFALVRFYRSSMPTESTLTKFDLTVTRLFSKFVDGERREMLCPRTEAVKYLTQRYSSWGVENFRSMPADDPATVEAIASFENLLTSAESVSGLSELVKSEVFDELRDLKRELGELLFVPRVTAAVIETNLRMATRVITLIEQEKERHGSAAASRLSAADLSIISDALGRTFAIDIADLQDQDLTADAVDTLAEKSKERKEKRSERRAQPSKPAAEKKTRRSTIFGVNRWLLFATILTVVVSLGIYVWAEKFTDEPAASDSVRAIIIDNAELKRFVKTAKLSGPMLYAVVTPAFEEMSVEVQRDYLKDLYQYGRQKGYSKVTLVNEQGRNVAFADDGRLEVAPR